VKNSEAIESTHKQDEIGSLKLQGFAGEIGKSLQIAYSQIAQAALLNALRSRFDSGPFPF
jgi:hypothetical protein